MGFQGISRRQLLGSCALSAVSGCVGVIGETVPAPTPDPAGDDWLSARYDARNTAYNPDASPPETRPQRQWSYDVGDIQWPLHYPWYPVVANGRVLVATLSGLHALSVEDGTVAWQFEPDQKLYAQPSIAGETVFLGSDDKTLYALSLSDGTERWTTRTPDWGNRSYGGMTPVLSPTIANDRIYAPAPGAMYVFDGEGTAVWRAHMFDPSSNVAVHGDRFFSVADTILSAGRASDLDASFFDDPSVDYDERELWRFDSYTLSAHDMMHATPAVAHDLVFVSVSNAVFVKESDDVEDEDRTTWKGEPVEGALYALDAETGERRWRHFVGGKVGHSNWVCPPVVVDDTIVVGGYDGPLAALDAETGRVRWRADLSNVRVAVGGGSTVVASGSDGIAAFDVRTGERYWTRDGERASGLAVAGDYIFVTRFDRDRTPSLRLHALAE